MENWLKSTLDIDINLNRNSISFGKINNLENLIILTIQYYIYPDKFTTSKKLSFENLKKNVINRLCMEKFILLKNCKYKEFNNCLRNVFTKYWTFIISFYPTSYTSLNIYISNLSFSSIKKKQITFSVFAWFM